MSLKIRTLTVTVTILIIAASAFAQTESYTTILLPLTPADIQGHDGARWVTSLTLVNQGDEPISFFCFSGNDCTPLAARAVDRLTPPASNAIVPSLMYVPDDDARRFTGALRATNTTPNSTERDFISEIPIVRESEFRSTFIDITAVPVEPNYRHMLRIYDASAVQGGDVRLQVWGLLNGELAGEPLIDEEVELTTSRGAPSPFALPDEPSWIQIGGFTERAGIRNFTEVHVRITAGEPNMEIWAFVTATNNTTQRFAVYTP